MTQFNFDKLTQRRGTNSYKWDETDDPDVIPVWVADMDFETAPCIVRALQERVAHGIFGYTFVPESYYEAVISWFQRRHHWRIDRSWIEYTSGVVPALSATIKALTQPGDKVLVQTPVYNCFFSSIRNNGCEIVESPLQRSANTYVINFDDLEQKLSDPAVKLFVLCNPHNPAGRVWTPDELRRMNDLCLRHNVRVVSDEIHCELTMPGYTYTPFASVSDECLNNSVTLNSPSKSFNTAGLQIANIISNDATIRQRINRAININEVCDVNPFGVVALQAAYNEGEEWLEQLLPYISDNFDFVVNYCEKHIPKIRTSAPDATYLMWLDCRDLGLSNEELHDFMIQKAKLGLNDGCAFGRSLNGYMRLNAACPRSVLEQAMRQLEAAVNSL